jgi:hypothetical protein
MSVIPVKEIKRNGSETSGPKHVLLASTIKIRVGTKVRWFTCGGCT